jgi:hypothetical protein
MGTTNDDGQVRQCLERRIDSLCLDIGVEVNVGRAAVRGQTTAGLDGGERLQVMADDTAKDGEQPTG